MYFCSKSTGGLVMPGLSDAQVTVLKKVVKDSNFRQAFVADPSKAITDSGVQLSPTEAQTLAKIPPESITQLTTGIKRANIAADGTHTLLYAVAIATLIA
jgi:hypothetical protein